MNDKDVSARLQELGWTVLQTKGSALDILGASEVLEADEVIEHAIQGTIDKAKGLLLATNRRLVFVNRGIFKTQSESFRYDKISSVQYQAGFLSTTIALLIDARTLKIDNVLKPQGASFADYVRQRVDQGSASASAGAAAPPDLVSQLERLADLRTKGILTEAEFQEQKQKLLR